MPEPIQTPVPAADELAAQVLLLAQSRLTADLRFLSSALEQLKPIPVPALDTLFAGDGRCLYYCPETLLRTFRAQQSVPTRALLHVTLHFGAGIIVTITFQQVDGTPNAETGTQSDNQSLKNFDSRVKEFHSRFSFIIENL